MQDESYMEIYMDPNPVHIEANGKNHTGSKRSI